MKFDKQYIDLVKESLDLSVESSGYPVTAESMRKAGLANRLNLRLLTRQGHIHSVQVAVQNEGKGIQNFNAYYTNNALPLKFMQEYGYAAKPNGALVAVTSEAN